MEPYKRQSVIYICFLICIIVTVLIMPLYSLSLFDSLKPFYDNFKFIIETLLQLFFISIIILICSIIIISIFI